MSYKVQSLPTFDRQVKRLAKKYPSLKADLRSLFDSLREGAALGRGCYKVRMAITSKKQGKSGGARVITFVKVTKEAVYLLSLYDKSEKKDLEPGELETHLEQISDDSGSI